MRQPILVLAYRRNPDGAVHERALERDTFPDEFRGEVREPRPADPDATVRCWRSDAGDADAVGGPSLDEARDDRPVRSAQAADGDDVADTPLLRALEGRDRHLLANDSQRLARHGLHRADHLAGNLDGSGREPVAAPARDHADHLPDLQVGGRTGASVQPDRCLTRVADVNTVHDDAAEAADRADHSGAANPPVASRSRIGIVLRHTCAADSAIALG